MLTGFGRYQLQKKCEKFDIDWEAEIDPALNYCENIRNLEQRYGHLGNDSVARRYEMFNKYDEMLKGLSA